MSLPKSIAHLWSLLSGRALEEAREDMHSSTIRLRAATMNLESRTQAMHREDAAAKALEKLEKASKALGQKGA